MNTVRLVAIEVAIGLVLSLAACIGVLYAIGNDGTTPLIEGSSVFLMAMGIGILAWIVLLTLARRVTAARGPGARVLASFLAATAAIVVNAILLGIVLAIIGNGALEFLGFALTAGVAFVLAVLVATPIAHGFTRERD